jgi:hypothetical protein
MCKKLFLVAMTVLLLDGVAFSAPVAGVDIADSVSFNGTNYSLNGTGVRKKFVMKLYVGSLYTNQAFKDENEILEGPVSAVIRLDIISGLITSKLMAETVQEGFEKAMDGDSSSLQPQIDSFIGVFNEKIDKGDSFTFVGVPGQGLTAYKGEKELKVIKDDYFRKILFSIWLGNDPADKNLKKDMLGK